MSLEGINKGVEMTEQELDKRIGIAELRGEMAQMNRRVDDVNKRIDDVRADVRADIADVRADIRDLRVTLRWVIGLQITMFIVLAGLILRGIGP